MKTMRGSGTYLSRSLALAVSIRWWVVERRSVFSRAIEQTTAKGLVSATTSYMGQEPAEAFFCIGAATLVDSATVGWSDGTQDVLRNVDGNQVLRQVDLLGIRSR